MQQVFETLPLAQPTASTVEKYADSTKLMHAAPAKRRLL